ncbi:PIF1-like helicase [Hirsutella rhossiliensis]
MLPICVWHLFASEPAVRDGVLGKSGAQPPPTIDGGVRQTEKIEFMASLSETTPSLKQEVSHLLLGLPLQEGSRTCLYVDCRHPDRHSRSLRIDGDEVDEAPNAYEKYCRRPEALEDLPYVSFLKYWNFRSRDPFTWKQWQPSNVNGRPRVLVYFPRYQADPEGQQWPEYCRVKLTLNHPHRWFDELLAFDGQRFHSYAKAFSYCWQHHSHGDDHYGRPKEARLQPQEDEYETLPVEEEFDDEDWIRLAALLPDNPPTQQGLDLLGRRDIDVNYDWTRHVGTYSDLRDGYWKDLIASHPMANDVEVLGPHWRNSLNPQQRLVYDTFMGHFQAQNPTQILLHVDGGGGTGKSFLIKVLSSHLQAAALPNLSPICRVAPTGVASNQIQGSTIHSLLRLPVGGTFTDLSPADAAALQSRLRHVKYIVIDEKSMLGLEQLARVDSRLRQAFPQRGLEFFGGVSVLLVGDFFQLPPVRQKPLYSTSTNLSSLERRGQVAYRLFDRTVFLTTVQRQAGDDQAQFRQALQELREVKLSIPSWNLLSSRVQARLTQSEVDSFRTALRVYSTKARVNEYSHEHMVHLNAPAIQVEANNQGKGAGQAPSDNAGNLSNKFPVAKGARVMLTINLWQPAGLVNGAQGTIYDVAWNAGANPWEDPPAIIMVDFDSYDGPPYLTTNEGRKIVPILPVRGDFLVGNETCARTQFPLMSLTKDQIVTDLATRDFQAGISYVAVSRVTSLQGLLLEAPFDRMKMRLADQQRRQAQQLTDPLYPPLYPPGKGEAEGGSRGSPPMKVELQVYDDWKGFYNEVTTETIRETNPDDLEPIGLRELESRPTRARRHPDRFDDEIYMFQQRSQTSRFTVAALPEHSRTEYDSLDKPPSHEISQESSLPADHRAYFRASINNGWKKLDEYYNKLGESPLFAAAVILHPRFGISWLEAAWVTEEQLAWVRDAKVGMKDYFARWYQTNQLDCLQGEKGERKSFNDKEQSKPASMGTGKEDDHYLYALDKYLRLEPEDTQEPIQWWRDHKQTFPALSSFALDVFAIPAMATDCERQFSLAKLAMRADTLEQVHCLKNWLGSWGGN